MRSRVQAVKADVFGLSAQLSEVGALLPQWGFDLQLNLGELEEGLGALMRGKKVQLVDLLS